LNLQSLKRQLAFTTIIIMNNQNNKTAKKKWKNPELKKFNKTDFIKSGAAADTREGIPNYKTGS